MLGVGVMNLPVTDPGFDDFMTMETVAVGQQLPFPGKLSLELRAAEQEARAAGRIVHPGIVTVLECGEISTADREEDLTAYIAMELLDGETLASRLERVGRLSAEELLPIVRQLAEALQPEPHSLVCKRLDPGRRKL